MMTNTEFVKILNKIVKSKTIYVLGGIGQPLTASAKVSLTQQYEYNRKPERKNIIYACSDDTFAFDCVGLIKSVLWGFDFKTDKYLGGAVYGSNGVPDIGADMMIKKCSDISYNFAEITVGEAVWLSGHIGVYVGDDTVIECTPAFKDCVQITELKQRNWLKHGKLPYIDYKATAKKTTKTKSVDTVAREVINGKWGNGADRRKKLTEAGYNYEEVQKVVNKMLNNPTEKTKSVDTVAREVINGKWGNGADRRKKLTEAGYNYEEVQKVVNKMLKK